MRLARRTFLTQTGHLAGAAALVRSVTSSFARVSAMVTSMAEQNVLRDTMNAFVAFVVPGPDEYSVAQGVSTPEPGGIDAQATDFLIGALDLSAPFAPGFAGTVAGILNDIARQVNPDASGPFSSNFARLSFAEKATVLSLMEGVEPLKPLAGVLPAIVAFVTYSEAARFDPASRTVNGQPIGWSLSHYGGVAGGRHDFQGYFHHRRKARD